MRAAATGMGFDSVHLSVAQTRTTTPATSRSGWPARRILGACGPRSVAVSSAVLELLPGAIARAVSPLEAVCREAADAASAIVCGAWLGLRAARYHTGRPSGESAGCGGCAVRSRGTGGAASLRR